MDEKKQIEEMARLACSVFDGNCMGCSFNFYPPCPPKASAERLYAAGYRKQSEGEWKERGEYICNSDGKAIAQIGVVFICSVCGREERHKEPYCHCGAKMKGE